MTTNGELVLTRNQRDEIMRAVKAIERIAGDVIDKSHWHALYVIGTNLTIIQTNVTNLSRAGSN